MRIRTILVDRENAALERMKDYCMGSEMIEICAMFDSCKAAVEYTAKETVHLAVIRADMPDMGGFDLGQTLKKMNEHIVLIYLIAHPGECQNLFGMPVDGLIFMPYREREVLRTLERACVMASSQKTAFARIQTFGEFRVLVNERQLYFSCKKAKELLAFAVNGAGRMIPMTETMEALWPGRPLDDKLKRLYRKAVGMLRKTLRESGAEAVFEVRRGCCRVVPELIDCDYYSYLHAGKHSGAYRTQYMPEYSWGEQTAAQLYFLNR